MINELMTSLDQLETSATIYFFKTQIPS